MNSQNCSQKTAILAPNVLFSSREMFLQEAAMIDLSNPKVLEMLNKAWLVVIRARAEREGQEREKRDKRAERQGAETQ